jgi:FkbM family methyltransferase
MTTLEAETAFPLRYRLYTPVHRGLTALGRLSIAGKHPVIVLQNALNRLMYRYALTAHQAATVQTREGFLITVPLDDQAAASILFNRQYSPEEGDVLRRLLIDCDAFLDVGANLGYFSLLALHSLQGRGPVAAVEPNHRLCALISESMAQNGLHTGSVQQAGVSDAPGEAYFSVDPKRTSHGQVRLEPSPDAVPIRIVTVDSLLAEAGAERRWLIKIDVEGLEARVLTGCAYAMQAGAVILCEVFADSGPEISRILAARDYTILDYRGNALPREALARHRRQDVILAPAAKSQAVARRLQPS